MWGIGLAVVVVAGVLWVLGNCFGLGVALVIALALLAWGIWDYDIGSAVIMLAICLPVLLVSFTIVAFVL